MTILKAMQKVEKAYEKGTYAEVFWVSGCRKQRLDLAIAIELREYHEFYNNHEVGAKLPFDNRFRVSKPEVHETYTSYTVYASDTDGELFIKAIIDVYPEYEYANYDWQKTFNDTVYPIHGIPWWKQKNLLS